MALASSSALASDTDISQVMTGVQNAINDLSVTHNNNGTTQSATNAANLLDWEGDSFDDLKQSAKGVDQTARNEVSSVWGMWTGLTQTSTNVLNSIDISDDGRVEVSTVDQSIRNGTAQVAVNKADYTQALNDPFVQGATNAGNLFNGRDINEDISQTFGGDSSQVASNVATGGGDRASVEGLAQTATNVVNSITADDTETNVKPATQAALLGSQKATNVLDFGGRDVKDDDDKLVDDGGLAGSLQVATNAANLITLDELRGTSEQTASLSQTAKSTARFVGSGSQWTAGKISGFSQSGTNAANILSVSEISSLSNELEISQISSASQAVNNSISGMGGTNTITQTAANVANSVSMPSVN